MKNIAIIFDFDGVLLDSPRFIRPAFNEILKPHGLSLEQIKEEHGIPSFRGMSLKNILAIIKEKYGKHFELEKFSKDSHQITAKLMEDEGIGIEPALLKFLDTLKENKISTGIGTASLKWRVLNILDQFRLSGYFKEIVGADDVSEHKPNPHVYLEAARRLEVEPGNCVVIEDSTDGIMAAHNAGMKAVAYIAHHTDPGIKEIADLTVSSFSELNIEVIKKLLRAL